MFSFVNLIMDSDGLEMLLLCLLNLFLQANIIGDEFVHIILNCYRRWSRIVALGVVAVVAFDNAVIVGASLGVL